MASVETWQLCKQGGVCVSWSDCQHEFQQLVWSSSRITSSIEDLTWKHCMQNAMHRNNDTTYMGLFLNNKIRCPALGVMVDITVAEHSQCEFHTQKWTIPDKNSVPLCTDPLSGGSWWQLRLGTRSGGTYNNNKWKQDFNNVYVIK